VWSAAFTPDGRECSLTIHDPENGAKEVHQWSIPYADEKGKLENRTARSPVTLSKDELTTRDIMLDGESSPLLAVRKLVRSEEVRCTCTALAYFDSSLSSYCSWSNLAVPGASSERTNSSTVMVGLSNGTVHFMDFHA
jgi:hypothetical protein